MNVRIDLTFSHDYEVEALRDLPSGPGGLEQVYFPGAEHAGGHDGVLVKITPTCAAPWLGIFAFGRGANKALTGVFSCPDRESICVVAAGSGYMVRAENPVKWEKVPLFPIFDVRLVPERKMLVFADFTRLTIYGARGILWITPSLSWDGITITEVTADYVKGNAWDAPRQREVKFSVNLETGEHAGGASPELARSQ